MRNFLLSALLFFSTSVFCDIIPEESIFVNQCFKIVNIDSFPDVTFIGNYKYLDGRNEFVFLSNSDCLQDGSKDFNYLRIYAVNTSYLDGRSLDEVSVLYDVNFSYSYEKIYPTGGYYTYESEDNERYDSIFTEYSILGFDQGLVYLYKHKEIYSFYTDKQDSIAYFEHEYDTNLMLPSIPVAINDKKANIGIDIYPNPASDYLYINLNNNHQGEVNFTLYSLSGQEVLSSSYEKPEQQFTHPILISDLPTGIYYLQNTFGETVYTEKIMIK